MVTNLQLGFDNYLPETCRGYIRTRIGDLLTRASGLKVLTLDATGRGCAEIPPIISGICPSFSLTELAFHLPITPQLWDFAFSQPTIRRLVLNCWYRPYVQKPQTDVPSPIPANALPQLEALLAPIEVVSSLLPGRPVRYVAVQSIHLFWPSDLNLEPLWQAISESSATLTALSIQPSCSQAFVALLQELPHRTPFLRFLGISTLSGSNLHWPPSPDLTPLRSMTLLECIRWKSRLGFMHDSDPANHAGPSLRHVQYEVLGDPGCHTGYEGTWEAVDEKGRVSWKLEPYFLSPRVQPLWELVCISIYFLTSHHC